MTFAVIKTGGKQYVVSPGDVLQVERLPEAEGAPVAFPEVLLVHDGATTRVGTPTVEGAVVRATIQKQGRARKVIIRKYKPKVRSRVTKGHRQMYSEVKIDSIS